MTWIRNARVADVRSPFYGEVVDLHIADGRIAAVGPSVGDSDGPVVDAAGMWVFPAMVDVMARWGEPASDATETLESGIRSAMQGGFSHVFLSPLSYPFYHDGAAIEALLSRTVSAPIFVHPIGSASAHLDTWQLGPIGEMVEAGAAAVAVACGSVSARHIQSLMEYMQRWEVPLIVSPRPGPEMLVWEGPTAVRMGLPGIRPEAEREWAATLRNLSRRTEVDVLFYPFSDPEAVLMSEDHFHPATDGFHLVWNDEKLLTWDARFKFSPPLHFHAGKDRPEILDHMAFIASGHHPVLQHHKENDFLTAAPGAIGHATLLPLLQSAFETRDFHQKILPLLTHRPRELMGLPAVVVEAGAPAELVLYHPDETWTLDASTNASRSINSPLWGRPLTGRVHRLITPRGTFNVTDL